MKQCAQTVQPAHEAKNILQTIAERLQEPLQMAVLQLSGSHPMEACDILIKPMTLVEVVDLHPCVEFVILRTDVCKSLKAGALSNSSNSKSKSNSNTQHWIADSWRSPPANGVNKNAIWSQAGNNLRAETPRARTSENLVETTIFHKVLDDVLTFWAFLKLSERDIFCHLSSKQSFENAVRTTLLYAMFSEVFMLWAFVFVKGPPSLQTPWGSGNMSSMSSCQAQERFCP